MDGRNVKCLVCAARVGQLVPFCEWCGAQHAFAGGSLVLTGAICQECGFQAGVPFSRCPQCRAQRRILCPACGTALAVRQRCAHCGLHFMFFDKVRREHNRTCRAPHTLRMSIAARKLVFFALVFAVGLPLCLGPDARWLALGFVVSLLASLAVGLGMVRLPRIWRARSRERDQLTVLETYELAEAMAARAWLRLAGIEAQCVTAAPHDNASSPPGGLRRIVVAKANLARAAACLADHGFELSGAARGLHQSGARAALRLVHSASMRSGEPRNKRDHD